MNLLSKIKKSRLTWIHILIIFLILIVFQVFVSRLQQNTLSGSIAETMDWSKQNSAEQIGNLTAASLEIMVELISSEYFEEKFGREKEITHALNTILRQPLMNRNVETICVIVPHKNDYIAMDIGRSIYNYFYDGTITDITETEDYNTALEEYRLIHEEIINTELTTSVRRDSGIFYVFVPLVPHGEYSGAVYFKVRPNITFISKQVLASFNQTVLIFSTLILVGLVAILLLSTYVTLERDQARELLYKERENYLAEHIAQKKEHLFTKRIYHTHHKAEKVMGFINEDLEIVNKSNFDEIKYRVSKYANFIARVIYDMKWFNPPINTIRGNIFNTDLNELLKFIVDNIFLRVSNPVATLKFDFDFDHSVPKISVNEFVMWEIIEPIIQNCIDHSNKDLIKIEIFTQYFEEKNLSLLTISDNGIGIPDNLLKFNSDGIREIFLENLTTKKENKAHGYGCYIAYEIAKRCGWKIDVENNQSEGSRFILQIFH